MFPGYGLAIRKLNSGSGRAGREGGREEEPSAKVPGEGWEGDAVGKDTYCQTRKLELHLRNPNGRRRKPAPVCRPLTSTCTPWHACVPPHRTHAHALNKCEKIGRAHRGNLCCGELRQDLTGISKYRVIGSGPSEA